MKRPNKKDYDFNNVFAGVQFASKMIDYCNHIEQKLKEAQKQVKDIAHEPVLRASCGKEPATRGIGETKTVCSECWNRIEKPCDKEEETRLDRAMSEWISSCHTFEYLK